MLRGFAVCLLAISCSGNELDESGCALQISEHGRLEQTPEDAENWWRFYEKTKGCITGGRCVEENKAKAEAQAEAEKAEREEEQRCQGCSPFYPSDPCPTWPTGDGGAPLLTHCPPCKSDSADHCTREYWMAKFAMEKEKEYEEPYSTLRDSPLSRWEKKLLTPKFRATRTCNQECKDLVADMVAPDKTEDSQLQSVGRSLATALCRKKHQPHGEPYGEHECNGMVNDGLSGSFEKGAAKLVCLTLCAQAESIINA